MADSLEAAGEAHPDDEILIIKYAIGGTSMMAWKPDWNHKDAEMTEDGKYGPLYAIATKFVKDIVGDRPVRYYGLAWSQGEDDAQTRFGPVPSEKYYRNLRKMILQFREDMGTDFPVFIPLPCNQGGAYLVPVRQAQMNLAAEMDRVWTIDVWA